MKQRTIARGALLAGGALAAVLVAGCQGNLTASGSGSGGSIATSASPIASSTVVATPPAVAPEQTDTPTPAPAGGAAPPAVKPAGTAECKASTLKLGLGTPDGAAGHVITPLTFTNVGSSACVMRGWPGVSYVTGNSGTQVGAPAVRDGAKGPQITLAPGQVASAEVQAADVGVYGGSCQPTAVRGFRVYAPDDTASMFVAHQTTGCADASTKALQVQTVKPGAGGA